MSRPLACTLITLCAMAATAPAAAAPAPPLDEHEHFLATLGKTTDLTWDGLAARWKLDAPKPDGPLSFDPARAAHHDTVAKTLDLSAEARATLAREGFVVARPPYGGATMASSLRDIFVQDLPLLVTTDAILDAVHRSYDRVLAELEDKALAPLLRDALTRAHKQLRETAKGTPALAEAAADVELYLLVALTLLDPGDDAAAEAYPSWGEPVPSVRKRTPALA